MDDCMIGQLGSALRGRNRLLGLREERGCPTNCPFGSRTGGVGAASLKNMATMGTAWVTRFATIVC